MSEQAKLCLELLRDVLGLSGAVLTAWAFFRLERRKKEATVAQRARISDPDLQKMFAEAGNTLVGEVLAANEIDARLTARGLVLISVSFLISILLTLLDYYGVFAVKGP